MPIIIMSTITESVDNLTTDTLNTRGKKYSAEIIQSYKTVIRNAFKSQTDIHIDTVNWDDTEKTSKLIDAITPKSYIPQLLGIIRVYRPDLLYYGSMADQIRNQIKEKGPNVFNQNVDGLEQKIDKITQPEYKLLFKLLHIPNGVRRMADYSSLKINNFDKKTDNYVTVGGRLVFNRTVKTSGTLKKYVNSACSFTCCFAPTLSYLRLRKIFELTATRLEFLLRSPWRSPNLLFAESWPPQHLKTCRKHGKSFFLNTCPP
jgi:hypothetical protein